MIKFDKVMRVELNCILTGLKEDRDLECKHAPHFPLPNVVELPQGLGSKEAILRCSPLMCPRIMEQNEFISPATNTVFAIVLLAAGNALIHNNAYFFFSRAD